STTTSPANRSSTSLRRASSSSTWSARSSGSSNDSPRASRRRRAAMAETEPYPTFLFADLAGFTALTEAHGDEEAAELAADFAEQTRALLASHAASAIKGLGDAMMIRVGAPEQAVLLGLRIVHEIGRQ